MKTFVKMMASAIVAGVVACGLIWLDASDRAVLSVYFGTAIGVALVLGVFDAADKSASEELRVKSEEGLARRPEGESQFATAHKEAA